MNNPDDHELMGRIGTAYLKYGPYKSTHEALGVIAEEYHELIDAVRSCTGDLKYVKQEALDIAAAALKLAQDCDVEKLKERSK